MSLPQIAPYPMPTAAELPAGRVAWDLDPARAVLLVHDMQRHFLAAFDPEREPVPALLANLARLVERARAVGMPVVYTGQPGGQSPAQRGLLQDFWGDGIADGDPTQFVEAVAPGPQDRVVVKRRYSAFVGTKLLDDLSSEGRDQLVVCGIYGHIGCLMTACHAFMQDISPWVVADAIADFSPEEHAMALRWAADRCAVVTSTDALLEQLPLPATPGLTRARIHDDLLAVLDDPPAQLPGDENLMDLGLDSLRVMSLVSAWRATGADVPFEALVAVEPTLDAWWGEIAAAGRVGAAR